MTNTRILSSPEFEGRRTNTKGGFKARDYVANMFNEIGLKPLNQGSFIQPFNFHNRLFNITAKGYNVVGYVEGTEWQNPSEGCLLIGAHYDHLGTFGGNIYYGADDNASGVSALFEIARSFVENPPLYPVVFLSFDAEELSCTGSHYFVKSQLLPVESMFLFVNMDMISISDKKEIMVAGTHYNHEYRKLIQESASKVPMKVKFGHDRRRDDGQNNWVYSSDHGEFHKVGVPFVYFGVEEHEHYHRTTDTFDNIDIGFFVESSQMILNFMDKASNKKSFLRLHRKLNK
ncbi:MULTISPECIES: M28 family peptidase [Flammeovirga]|uniref:M28 family peptidase n=1 Tax=Flammeovirga agarivorans TaxID=2726742 RepID=A0A7X8SQP9_9BACT|nr:MULTISPECIES: M28 family peptidase [Flammeovirga]NLR94538.1 M28 family peptidase [Flammeovirga agarivorans]